MMVKTDEAMFFMPSHLYSNTRGDTLTENSLDFMALNIVFG